MDVQAVRSIAKEIAAEAELMRGRAAIFTQWSQVLLDMAAQAASPAPSEMARVRLDVPWASQLGEGAGYAAGDCGTACLTMWLRFLGHEVSVDDVSRATGLPEGFSLSGFSHLQKAGRNWGLELAWARLQSVEDLRGELEAGRPVIALVHYLSLPARLRYDKNYPYSHWVVVVGIGEGMIVYHDPYFRGEGGDGVEVSEREFSWAWGNNHLAGNKNSDRAMVVGGG
jgi:uncharacterized protein YvpB